MTEAVTNQLALACSPYKAEGATVWKMQTRVPCRGTDITFLSFPVCQVNENTEDPAKLASLIADAMNAHQILRVTETETGKDAVQLWLHHYMSSTTPNFCASPKDCLDGWRDAQTHTYALIARYGLVLLVHEACRRMAESLPAPSTELLAMMKGKRP